jgi:hypothetical protein
MEKKMATAKVNGTDYSVPPNTKNSGAVNNRGVATRSGSSVKLTNVGVSRYNTTVFASTVIDNDWADKALDGGAFAYNNSKPVAQRSSTTIAGVSSSALKNGANVPGQIRSIHKLEVLRTRRLTSAIRANKYNRYTNTWDAGYPVVAEDTLATDTAATPTRAEPGQLTYKLGNPVPVSDNDYKPKTDG